MSVYKLSLGENESVYLVIIPFWKSGLFHPTVNFFK